MFRALLKFGRRHTKRRYRLARKDVATVFGLRNALHAKSKRVRLRKVLAFNRRLASTPQRWLYPVLLKRGHNIRASIKNPTRLVRLGLVKKFLTPDSRKILPRKVIEVKKSEVCRARKQIRREVFRRSRGRGMRVRKANWSPLSLVRCK